MTTKRLEMSLSKSAVPRKFRDQSDQSIAIVPPEMLCDWLRDAFHLSETQSEIYLRLTFAEYRRKRQEKILAEDLCKQLTVIEAHSHPFYAPDTFFVSYT